MDGSVKRLIFSIVELIRMKEEDGLFIYLSASRDRKHEEGPLSGVSTLQETDLTGPTYVY